MRKIKLTNCNKYTLVDDDDFEILNLFKWRLVVPRKCCPRVMTEININAFTKGILMHRLIMKDPLNKQIDHINHDGLDNRKCNLRICNSSQNNSNRRPSKKGTSKYKGVSWNQKDKAWGVTICKNAI